MDGLRLVNQYMPWNKVIAVDESYRLCIRGYAFIDGQYYSGDALVQHVSNCLDKYSSEDCISILKKLIPQLNGGWALVYETDGIVLAAVDRFRSIPLFYAVADGRIFLSDEAGEVLKSLGNAELDDICAAEFLVTGYVTRKDTLYKGLFQIQPGEILEVIIPEDASPKISTHQYYRFIFGNYFEADEHELEEDLFKLLYRTVSRYAIALKGKTPVIPLSGGLDSRLIAAMLKECGVDNVICFSYGRHGNAEAEASRAVAKALGYKWLFCPYDSWYDWFREEQFRLYIDYADGRASISHEQDWPATRMILNDISHNDVVFIPGHSLDMLAGSHTPSELFEAKENATYDALVPEAVLSHHYVLWPWRNACSNLKDLFVERIREVLPAFSGRDKSEAIGVYETWNFESRQVRFIINSVRVYEFFCCQWMLPWWDYDLMDFFLRVKLNLRFRKKLYRSTLLNRVFINQLSELAKIPVVGLPLSEPENGKKENDKYSQLSNLIHRILSKVLPDFIKDLRCASNRYRKDPLALYEMYVSRESIFTKLEAILPTCISSMPPSVQRILQINIKRPAIACTNENGLHSAYHIALRCGNKS